MASPALPLLRLPVRAEDAFDLFRRLVRSGDCALLLDSCPRTQGATSAERELRRFSVAAAAPATVVTVKDGHAWRRDGDGAWLALRGAADPFALARALLAEGPRVAAPDVPFAGGVAGFFAYDAGRHVERLPATAVDDASVPDALLARFPAALVVDHEGESAFIVAADDAEGRAHAHALAARLGEAAPPLGRGDVPAPRPVLPRAEFEDMVRRARDHVRTGDVFQVNLSHRLDARAPSDLDPLALYARLRDANPAPMSGVLLSGALPSEAGGGFALLSSSPERLFSMDASRRLEARPIAGTRPRGDSPTEDAALAAELAADEKERAEHVMLVDLARNDLGRVADFGSVRVPRLLAVETYRRVHHLVSTVEARLRDDADAVDALAASFPGGTITGAPKVRAMEIIEALEGRRRGAYTGGLGYFSQSGATDWNILIRTLVVAGGRVSLQVGAGIVWDSVPEREHAETLAKAEALLGAFGADGLETEARLAG